MDTPSKNPFAKIVSKILEYRTSGTVLDVGAGKGYGALYLAQQGFEVTALDLTDTEFLNIEQAAGKENIAVRTIKGNILALHEVHGTFDIVLCASVLHFLSESDVDEAVKQLKAVTKIGGLNAISVHTAENTDEQHPHLFVKDELRKYYTDWEVLHYWEGVGRPFETETGKIIQRQRADLIAEKQK